MKIKLYNPTSEDFHIKHDTNGDRHPQAYCLHAQEIEAFEEPVAIHIKNALAYKIAMSIKSPKESYESALEKALALMEIPQ